MSFSQGWEKAPEAHRGSQSHQTIAAPPSDGVRHQPLPKQRRRESRDPDHQEESGDQTPLDHEERQKREAAKLPEIACPYHDDIAISDRSKNYGVEST